MANGPAFLIGDAEAKLYQGEAQQALALLKGDLSVDC